MLHALRVLRCHGMNDAALKIAYQAVVPQNMTTLYEHVFSSAAGRVEESQRRG